MAHRNLAAVGKTGFLSGCRLTLNDRHGMSIRRQVPRAGDADYAGAKYDYTHRRKQKLFAAGLI
jgi:hypothetical protein